VTLPHKLVIWDADGTLRRCTVPGQVCPNREGEWELIPGVVERLQQIDWTTTRAAIASNQGGVALGYLSLEMASELLWSLARAAFEPVGLPADRTAIGLCIHAPNAGCECRKPRPGMLIALMKQLDATPAETLFVGDQESDRLAAEAAGCAFMWARDFFGWP
jgi:histidinol-phosphate phosphatase family protein